MLLLEIIIALVMVPSSLKAITDTDLLQLDGANEEIANSQRASQDEESASTIPQGDALPGTIIESLPSDLSSSNASSKDLGVRFICLENNFDPILPNKYNCQERRSSPS